jgi:hypothetical protein
MLGYDDVPGQGMALLLIPGFSGHRGEYAAQVAYFGGARCARFSSAGSATTTARSRGLRCLPGFGAYHSAPLE